MSHHAATVERRNSKVILVNVKVTTKKRMREGRREEKKDAIKLTLLAYVLPQCSTKPVE